MMKEQEGRDTLELEYRGLADGERRSGQLCPVCDGGASREKSLSVSRHRDHLRFMCFRASCNFRGRINLTPSAARSSTVQGNAEPKRERRVIVQPLPEHLANELSERYMIEPGIFEWAKWVYTSDYMGFGPRVGMPILDPNGEQRGTSWRSYTGVIPKALIARSKQEEMICWYRGRKYGKTLVVVEDQASALRVAAQGVDALALCGTLLTLNRIYEIKGQNYEKVFLCLDEDATGQAIKHSVAYKARLPQLNIMALNEDIKNMNEVQFEMFIQNVSLP